MKCPACHQLGLDLKAKDHEFYTCPKRDFILKGLETKFSRCNICGDWTRYDTAISYACFGKCLELSKRQDRTIDLISKETGRIHVEVNSYMGRGKANNKNFRKFG